MDVSSLFKNLSIGGGLGSALGGIAGLFGNNKQQNPANEANKYLNQIPGAINPYFQPYINAGQRVQPGLESKYGQLANNPGEVYNQLGAGYKESPGYQLRLKEALGAAGNAQAAGGMLGTPLHSALAGRIGEQVAGDDFEQYLNHILGLMQGGLGGQQNIANQGYEAGTRYGENIGNVLGSQAQYGYAGKDFENQNTKQNWANIFGGAGQALPWLFGGGGESNHGGAQ